MDVGKSIAVAVLKGEESEEREGSGFSRIGGWRIFSEFQALIWRSSSFLFSRRVDFFWPPSGWGSSGPPFLDLSKKSRFLIDF